MTEFPRILALGGGTGLPVVLRGLASRLGASLEALPEHLTGVVTVTDDGGSSGRLRRERGMLPPGDVRNCLVALGRDPHSLAEVFQYRYRKGNGRGNEGEDGLAGHTLGNLILAALAEKTGCFLEAIERASQVLAVRGRILPSTLEDVVLVARMDDGSELRGESSIAGDQRAIRQVRLEPESPEAAPGVVEAIERADLVVLAPGSLYSSLLPNLMARGVAGALRRSGALRVMVGNLMTQPGETDRLDGEAHLRAVIEHLGPSPVHVVLVPSEEPDPELVRRYETEGQMPVHWGEAALARHGARLVRRPLLAPGRKVRHDAQALAGCLLELAAEHGRRRAKVG